VLELVYLSVYPQAGSTYGYLIVYLLYSLELTGLVAGYLVIRRSAIVKLIRVDHIPGYLAWFILFLAFTIYLPVLLEFSNFILQPREIYMRTRTGYGLNYFGSLFFANLAFLIFLFYRGGGILGRLVFLGVLFFVIGMHGSKGAFVTIFLIYLLFLVYIKKINQSLKRTVYYGAVFSATMVTLFYFTLPESMKAEFLKGIVNYSDYSRHAIMVVDQPPDVTYGRLIFEDNIVSLVPRAVFPEKPKDFGSFFLSKHYFPEWFYGDTGSPAFGVGTYYADFREASLVVIFFVSFAIGSFIKIFLNRVVKFQSPSDFIMLIFFAGVPLLNLGTGYLVIPHFAIVLFLALVFKLTKRQTNFSKTA
jgi:hypothetical protein